MAETTTLRNQIMAEIGFDRPHRVYHGSYSCSEIRRRAAALLPIRLQSHRAAGEIIAPPSRPLLELVRWIADNDIDKFSLWRSWELTHEVIGAHINSALKMAQGNADAADAVLQGVYADLLVRYIPKAHADRVAQGLAPLPGGIEDRAREVLREVHVRLRAGTLRAEIECLPAWKGKQDNLVFQSLVSSLLLCLEAVEEGQSVDEMFQMAMLQVEIAYRVNMIDRSLREHLQKIFAGTTAQDLHPDLFARMFSSGLISLEEEST